jgi:hypothetical protein
LRSPPIIVKRVYVGKYSHSEYSKISLVPFLMQGEYHLSIMNVGYVIRTDISQDVKECKIELAIIEVAGEKRIFLG